MTAFDSEARHRLLERRLQGQAAPAAIPRRPRGGPLPLSHTQRRMWLLDRLLPGTAEYVVPLVLRLPAPVRVSTLRAGLNALAERHEILRTRYEVVDGEVYQVIDDPGPVRLAVVEPRAEPEALAERVQREIVEPFDLLHGPVWRATLLQGDDVLVLAVHHIACDGWSMGILGRELKALYEGRELPELPLQFADFAVWQRDRLAGDALRRRLDFWHAALAGLEPLQLPTDRPRTVPRDPRADRVNFTVPAPIGRALAQWGRARGATLFMTLLTAFGTLLSRHTGQTDLAVGTPVLGRPRSQTEDVVGPFINTLVLRCDLAGDPTFAELLDRVREMTLTAFAHDDLPFEQLVEELRPERDLSRTPLVQAMLLLEGGPGTRARDRDSWEELPVASPAAKVDLTLGFQAQPDGSLLGGLEYAAALFDGAGIKRMADQLLRLLAAVVENPDARLGRLTLMDAAEAAVIEAWSTGPQGHPSERCLHELVSEAADRWPEAVAVVSGSEALTYTQLESRANQLAHELRTRGVGADRPVAVCLHRSVEQVIALLAVLKAGGAYLPLDPDDPPGRRAALIAESGAPCVVTRSGEGADLPDVPMVLADTENRSWPDTEPPPVAGPANLAYVIYTSGSTGRPKGVMVPHEGIVNRLRWMQDRYSLAPGDRVAQKTPYTFDVSVWEFFWPLMAGATVIVAPPGAHRDPHELAEFMDEHQVTHVHFVPTMLDAFLDHVAGLRNGRCPASLGEVFASGETLRPGTAHRFFAQSDARLHNLYGPTEASIDVTAHEVSRAAHRVPIGAPIAGVRAYVLDEGLSLVPVGAPGEIHLGGAGLARGYLGRPGLTADRFVPDPRGTGQRLYRTGDRGRLLPDGSLEYLGRLDGQVKLRGLRIEPGEIEAALLTHPAVAQAAVAVVREQLVGYVVPGGRAQSGDAELRAYLSRSLPAHLIPARFVRLAGLPLTASGKTDRAQLPEPLRPDVTSTFVAPRTPVEELIAAAWCEVLGVDRVGVTEGFFDLGGDSMRAIRLAGTLRSRGLEVTVQDIFTRTIETLAETAGGPRERIDDLRAAPLSLLAEEDRGRLPGGVDDAYPLSEVQAGMVFELLADPHNMPYQNVTAYRIIGALAAASLRRAAAAVALRHPVLRTAVDLETFSEPLQVVYRRADPEVAVTSLVGAVDAHAVIEQTLAAERLRPFDLTSPPLWRLHAFEVSADEWWLAIVECHVILDGWSHNTFLAELLRAYADIREGRTVSAVVPEAAYADFIAVERRALASSADRDFWAARLSDHERLRLPYDWAEPGPDRVTAQVIMIDHLEAAVGSLASACGVSPKTVFLAAFAATMAPLAASDRYFFGMVSSSRPEAIGGYDVLGMFLNTVPFSVTRPSGTWRELIADVFAEEIALWPHRRFPLPALQRTYGGRMPLIEVAFGYLDFYTVASTGVVDLAVTKDDSPNEFPVEVTVMPGRLLITSRRVHLGEQHAAELGARFAEVLGLMVAEPDAPVAGMATAAGTVGPGVTVSSAPRGSRSYMPPGTRVERSIVAVWEEVLEVSRIGVTDDFYEVGGHSLAAMRIASRLRTAHGVHVTPRQVLECGTCAELAQVAVGARSAVRDPSDR
ncbi:amino acid adenylation domain-containing protein [Streptomyces sp. NPDC059679]|uniref:non-ribosomal peptide synthetase n=1 Tax=Streptomyces sp. NPDC059679 TaxID=3346903 RepID=UPI0036BECAAE